MPDKKQRAAEQAAAGAKLLDDAKRKEKSDGAAK